MGKGGGSQQPTTSQVNQSNLPEYARPYFEDLMQRGQTASQVQYQPYGGERTAGFTPMQEQGFQGVQNLGPSSLNAPAAGMTTAAGIGGLSAGQYQSMAPQQTYQGSQFQNMGLQYLNTQAPNLQQYQMGPAQQVRGEQTGAAQTNYAPNLQQYQMGPAERTGTGSFAAPGAAAAYMSPYAQQAIDPTLRENQRQFDVASTGRQAAATRSGAFGGSRQAIEQSEAQRNLGRLQSDTQAQGMQAAYQNAQQQFNADQARGMQSQLANQGAYGQMQGLGMQQNLSANQQDMQNRQLQAQYGLAGQQAGEQSNQFASNYDLQNRQAALAAAQGLGSLGMQNYQQNMGIAQAQALGGAQVQAQEQQELSQNYQDFLNQQNYPYKQLGFMSDLIRGTPTSGGAATMYQAPPSAQSQTVGLLGGLGSLAGAYTASQPK